MEAKKLVALTVKDYLQVEQESDTKYEFHDGEIFAMAGGTIEHGLISGNMYGEVKFALRGMGKDCKTINNDVKLHIEASNKFLYPDMMVICGEIERSATMEDAVVNPLVVIEVLSKSTESYDRGDKFFAYRIVPTLKEYVLIDQYYPKVDIYKRDSGLWNIERFEGKQSTLTLSSLGISVRLEDIYENVTFSEG